MVRQRTLKKPVQVTGVGLHTGDKVSLTLRPAAPDSGIIFRRVDLMPVAEIRADAFAVHDTRLSTCLEAGGARVATVEHLMSAFAGMGIDNACVDLTSAELAGELRSLPIPVVVVNHFMDGNEIAKAISAATDK